MVRLFVRHNVADYGAWRKAYDEFDEERAAMGVTGDAVFQSIDNPTSPCGTTSTRPRRPKPSHPRTS
jgi:hypothetical protein